MSVEQWEPSEEDIEVVNDGLAADARVRLFYDREELTIIASLLLSASPYPRIAEALEDLVNAYEWAGEYEGFPDGYGAPTAEDKKVCQGVSGRARASLAALKQEREE